MPAKRKIVVKTTPNLAAKNKKVKMAKAQMKEQKPAPPKRKHKPPPPVKHKLSLLGYLRVQGRKRL